MLMIVDHFGGNSNNNELDMNKFCNSVVIIISKIVKM